MNALRNLLSRLRTAPVGRDERGVTAIEYALIGVLVGVAVVGGIAVFGTSLSGKFALLDASLTNLPGK